jgi:hypothetical protein
MGAMKLLKAILLCLLVVFIYSCAESEKVTAILTSKFESNDRIEFILSLTSEEKVKLEVFSDAKGSLMLGSLGHNFKGQREIILSDRRGERELVDISLDNPYRVKFYADLKYLENGKLKLDFGELGFIEFNEGERLEVGVVFFPIEGSSFSSNDGIVSNFVPMNI